MAEPLPDVTRSTFDELVARRDELVLALHLAETSPERRGVERLRSELGVVERRIELVLRNA